MAQHDDVLPAQRCVGLHGGEGGQEGRPAAPGARPPQVGAHADVLGHAHDGETEPGFGDKEMSWAVGRFTFDILSSKEEGEGGARRAKEDYTAAILLVH